LFGRMSKRRVKGPQAKSSNIGKQIFFRCFRQIHWGKQTVIHGFVRTNLMRKLRKAERVRCRSKDPSLCHRV
jgi:hypothetical protein